MRPGNDLNKIRWIINRLLPDSPVLSLEESLEDLLGSISSAPNHIMPFYNDLVPIRGEKADVRFVDGKKCRCSVAWSIEHANGQTPQSEVNNSPGTGEAANLGCLDLVGRFFLTIRYHQVQI